MYSRKMVLGAPPQLAAKYDGDQRTSFQYRRSMSGELEQLAGKAVAQAVTTNSHAVSAPQTLTTARAFQPSAYDAVYLDLARRERLPLATLDERLRAAAVHAGAALLR